MGAKAGQAAQGDPLLPAETPRAAEARRARSAAWRRCAGRIVSRPRLPVEEVPAVEQATPDEASDLLDEWLAWPAPSRLGGPFVKLPRTVRKHAAGILVWLRRIRRGRTEGCARAAPAPPP